MFEMLVQPIYRCIIAYNIIMHVIARSFLFLDKDGLIGKTVRPLGACYFTDMVCKAMSRVLRSE